MKVVIVAATEKELAGIEETAQDRFRNLVMKFLVTGVGMLSTSFYLTRLILEAKPDLIIQIGIAGSFNQDLQLGQLVAVRQEILGDTGVEESHGFKDLFDMKLLTESAPPFTGVQLTNPWFDKYNLLELPEVCSITINEVTTRPERIAQLLNKYKCEIEGMEGAALHYCCLQTGTPFFQMRSISNFVGERDKLKWNFSEAQQNLTRSTYRYLEKLNNQ